jgi:hypothetical protein
MEDHRILIISDDDLLKAIYYGAIGGPLVVGAILFIIWLFL